MADEEQDGGELRVINSPAKKFAEFEAGLRPCERQVLRAWFGGRGMPAAHPRRPLAPLQVVCPDYASPGAVTAWGGDGNGHLQIRVEFSQPENSATVIPMQTVVVSAATSPRRDPWHPPVSS
jgi:hypothetical protein